MPVYLGETAGARIIQYGVGITQVGTDFQADVETWDALPAGEMGDCVYRSIGVAFSYTNGYSLGVTPIVDGVAGVEVQFGGVGAGDNGQAQVFLRQRGTKIAARVRTLARSGQISLKNITAQVKVLRTWP